MILLTKQQRASLHRKWQQNNQGMTYREFRKTVQHAPGMDCVLVEWSGMWLGIEQDGYTHS